MTIEVEKIDHQEMQVIEGDAVVVIYENPSDFPGKFVARLWDLHKGHLRPTGIVATAASVQEVREKIPRNILCPMGRMPGDDLCIVETWL